MRNMQFFNLFYRDVFMIGGIEINDRIKFSINNYNEYEKLNEIIQSCKYFSSAQLSELAIIKGFSFEAYKSPGYSSENILSFLEKLSLESKWQEHKTIATNCIKEITKFTVDLLALSCFVDKNNDKIKIHELRGKFTYVNFLLLGIIKVYEMEIIKQFKEDYSFINYISINLDL